MKPLLYLVAVVGIGVAIYFQFFASKPPKPLTIPQPKPAPRSEEVAMGELLKKYTLLANAGDPLAIEVCHFAYYDQRRYNEGDRYLPKEGKTEIPVDEALLKRVLNSTHPFFNFIKGVCLLKGIGVEIDQEKAYGIFADEANLPYAKAAFAACLLAGKGATANPEQAVETLEGIAPHIEKDLERGRTHSSSFHYEDGYYRTVLSTCRWDREKYPPALLALGDAFMLGEGVPQNISKALKYYLDAHVAGLKRADVKIQELFKIAVRNSKDDAEKRLGEFSNSQEFENAVLAFQSKNRCLKSMPASLEKETAAFKARYLESKRQDMLSASLRDAGWLVFGNFGRGIPLEGYEIDKGIYIDMATDYLCRYYRMQKVFPQGVRENAELLGEKLRTLVDVAKANGSEMDAISLQALALVFNAKLNPEGSSSSTEFERLCATLGEMNGKSPSAETLVSESYALLHMDDLLADECVRLSESLKTLEHTAKVKRLAYRRNADPTFGGKEVSKYSWKNKTGNPPDDKEKEFEQRKRNQLDRIVESLFYNVQINDEDWKTMPSSEFQVVKKEFDAYISEKSKLESRLEANSKMIFANNAKRRRNTSILNEMFKDNRQLSSDAAILKDGASNAVEVK